jgi:hypothetical protein
MRTGYYFKLILASTWKSGWQLVRKSLTSCVLFWMCKMLPLQTCDIVYKLIAHALNPNSCGFSNTHPMHTTSVNTYFVAALLWILHSFSIEEARGCGSLWAKSYVRVILSQVSFAVHALVVHVLLPVQCGVVHVRDLYYGMLGG